MAAAPRTTGSCSRHEAARSATSACMRTGMGAARCRRPTSCALRAGRYPAVSGESDEPRTTRICCADLDGEGPADDGVLIMSEANESVVLAAVYEQHPGVSPRRSGRILSHHFIRNNFNGPTPSYGCARSSLPFSRLRRASRAPRFPTTTKKDSVYMLPPIEVVGSILPFAGVNVGSGIAGVSTKLDWSQIDGNEPKVLPDVAAAAVGHVDLRQPRLARTRSTSAPAASTRRRWSGRRRVSRCSSTACASTSPMRPR